MPKRKIGTALAREMAALRKHKSGGGRGRMPGAISDKPHCQCATCQGRGLTLERAMKRHPLRARG